MLQSLRDIVQAIDTKARDYGRSTTSGHQHHDGCEPLELMAFEATMYFPANFVGEIDLGY